MLKSPGSREVSICGGGPERHRYGLSCRGTRSSNPFPSSEESTNFQSRNGKTAEMGSIAHEQPPVVTAPIALPVRRRYPAANSHTLPMAPSASTSAAKTRDPSSRRHPPSSEYQSTRHLSITLRPQLTTAHPM